MEIVATKGIVIKNIKYAQDCRKLSLELPLRLVPLAGQFLHLLVGNEPIPLLRRPFSIYDYRAGKNSTRIDILFRVVGKGTRLLSEKSPPEELDLLLPLGRGFEITHDAKTILLVAGGIGIAPLHLLAKNSKKMGKELVLLFGARTKSQLYALKDLKRFSKVLIATEDGSLGKKALVSELLEEYLERTKENISWIYSCGPEGMIKKVSEIAKRFQVPCQVSLERRMACGLGICGGCVVRILDKDGNPYYSRICLEGPVYDARRII